MIKGLGGEDAYRQYIIERGSRGGSVKVPKGFAVNRELASIAGRKGGLVKASNRRVSK